MKYEIIAGKASHINHGSDFSYVPNPVGNAPLPVKRQVFNFRLDGREVTFNTDFFPSLAEGDDIAVVGIVKDGFFRAGALRNLTTRSDYFPRTSGATFLGWTMIVLGILTITLMGAGLLLIGYGIWTLMKVGTTKKAYKTLCGVGVA